MEVDPREPRLDWRRDYGEPPYYRLQQEYSRNNWDTVLFVGEPQLKRLHELTGAILAKKAHASRT